MKKVLTISVMGSVALVSLLALIAFNHASSTARADSLQAVPWIFVGNAGDCAPGWPAASNIVTSAWLGGMGLPDNGGQNVGTNPQDNPNKNDPHRGLLLSKNGTTPDCSSAGATIKGVKGMTVTATSSLGFDFRNGGHCGAGAPRFNVNYTTPTNTTGSSFVGGCGNMTQIPAPQDPLQWTRAMATLTNPAQAFPPIPVNSKITSIDIVYDEGTDTTSAQDANGVGLAVLDNITVNGQVIATGTNVAEPHGPKSDHHDKEHGDDGGDGNGNGHGNGDHGGD